jgi:endoglucanase
MGEFGGRSVGQDPEGQWQRELVAFLKREGISYTYWSWNPDSGDTGGLLEDDWQTLNPDKLALLQSYQWPRAARLQADGIVAAG